MKPRKRVLAALNHIEPDRIPIDFSGHRSSGIAALAYAGLRENLGLPEKSVRVYDVIQQLAIVDEDVLDRFHVDTVELGRGFATREEDWSEWVLPDGSPCLVPVWVRPERQESRWILRSPAGKVIAHMPDGALYFEQTFYPFFHGKENLSDLAAAFEEFMWASSAAASPPGPVSDDELAAGAKKLRKSSERAIVGLFGGNLMETGQMFYRNDGFLYLLAAEPKRAHLFLDKLVEHHLENLDSYLELVGDSIDIILFGDDLGMQTGPQISPKMYREFFKPRHRELWNRAKSKAEVKVMLHCCGGVRELLPDLIEAGLDAINPVQISCAGMEVETLKRDFGRELTFWGGGCDTRTMLPDRKPEEIRRHVAAQIAALKPGGGFVFQQVHNILADVPAENITAMFDAAYEYSAY